jgi:hypothetical protein
VFSHLANFFAFFAINCLQNEGVFRFLQLRDFIFIKKWDAKSVYEKKEQMG